MTDAEIEATKAPLMEHLIELRSRLVKALTAFVVLFVVCFFFAKNIYNVLVLPYQHVAGPDARLIYTAPQEYFFTQIQVAFFAAAFLSCPIVFSQLYAFVAPGLYKHERNAFRPYLWGYAGVLRARGAHRLLHRHAEPAALLHRHAAVERAGPRRPDRAAAARQRIPVAGDDADPGFRRDVPVAGDPHSARAARHRRLTFLRAKRRYAIVLVVVASAILTPPDAFSMLALVVPAYALYEGAIITVHWMAKKKAEAEAKTQTADGP